MNPLPPLGEFYPRLCRAVMKATGTKEYNLLQNNGSLAHQAVMHVHYHIIPKPDGEKADSVWVGPVKLWTKMRPRPWQRPL